MNPIGQGERCRKEASTLLAGLEPCLAANSCAGLARLALSVLALALEMASFCEEKAASSSSAGMQNRLVILEPIGVVDLHLTKGCH